MRTNGGIAAQAIELEDPERPVAHRGMALRVEPCACGGSIAAADNPGMIRAAVETHNATTQHEEWRAVHALQRPARRPCPCHE